MNITILEKWANTFISMILEALPFILIGALVSAIIQMYISEELVKRILPKNKFISMLFAALIGVFIPICECAIVTIAKSLIKKGVPIGVAIVFMLSVPIVNPVVILSTFYAFSEIKVALIRVLGGIVCAIVIGSLMDILSTKNKNIIKNNNNYDTMCDCGCVATNYFYNKSKIRLCLEHANKEFSNILKYYILGSFLSSSFIVMVDKDMLNIMSGGKYIPIIIMMTLSFLLSLCSEADAFIARGFLNHFGLPATSAFLILGPMLDLKNSIIIGSYFKKGFALKLIILIPLIVLGFSIALSIII